jgi:hypothetical protein
VGRPADLSGNALTDGYVDILRGLGKQPGMLGDIYAGAQSRFANPVNLKRLVGLCAPIRARRVTSPSAIPPAAPAASWFQPGNGWPAKLRAAPWIATWPSACLVKAFRGELCPTEAELARQEGRDYEPASVLLARISANRAAQGDSGKKSTRRPRPTTPAPATAKRGRRKTSDRSG